MLTPITITNEFLQNTIELLDQHGDMREETLVLALRAAWDESRVHGRATIVITDHTGDSNDPGIQK